MPNSGTLCLVYWPAALLVTAMSAMKQNGMVWQASVPQRARTQEHPWDLPGEEMLVL
jgi:hypothetical protein